MAALAGTGFPLAYRVISSLFLALLYYCVDEYYSLTGHERIGCVLLLLMRIGPPGIRSHSNGSCFCRDSLVRVPALPASCRRGCPQVRRRVRRRP